MQFHLSHTYQGILFILAGSILFLYSTGLILRGIDVLVIASSVIMIIWGLVLVEGHKKVMQFMSGKKDNNGPRKPNQPKPPSQSI